MFRNIQDKILKNTKEETVNNTSILANVFSKKYILLYIVTFMASTVGTGQGISPFSLAICAAAAASEVPVIGIIIVALTRKYCWMWHIKHSKLYNYITSIFCKLFNFRARI